MNRTRTFPTLFLAAILLSTSALAQDTIRRLTQAEALKAAVSKPQPDYPPMAKQLKVEGRVEVEVSIDTAGTVSNVRALAGNVALTGAAVSAVKRWKFDPITESGKPVPAVAVIAFTFKMP